MARIQVLPLGSDATGPFSTPAFAVIIDKLDDNDRDLLRDLDRAFPAEFKTEFGAKSVLVYDGELTVENADEALAEAVYGWFKQRHLLGA